MRCGTDGKQKQMKLATDVVTAMLMLPDTVEGVKIMSNVNVGNNWQQS